MNRKILLLPITLLMALIAPSISAQSDEVGEIRALLERVATLMQAGDLESLNDIYSDGPGVHIIEGAGVNHGWVDYRDHHLTPELEAFKNFKYRFFAIEPQIRGNLAYTALRYELSADLASGHIEREGRGTFILEKTNDEWRIVHTHTSGRTKR